MQLQSPVTSVTIPRPPAIFQAAATVLDTVNDTLGGARRAIEAGTDVADSAVLSAFDDAYVQASTAASLLDTSPDSGAGDFAEGIRQSILGVIRTAKATAMDTVVDVPTVLEFVAAARNEALAVAQELRASTVNARSHILVSDAT